ncbi:MAG: hypothetical protein ACRDF0_10395 [Candidatus Limnocylindria bacterium]
MKDTLATLGLAALVCLPCLVVLAGGALVASGALALAVVRDPVIQVAALLVLALGVTLGWRYLAARRACETDPFSNGRRGQPGRARGQRPIGPSRSRAQGPGSTGMPGGGAEPTRS